MTAAPSPSGDFLENRGYARATIVADSISPAGRRLTTMEVVFARVVLAEYNTHRMIVKNSASSRAIPTEKMIERLLAEHYVPTFTRNKKGMQGTELLPPAEQEVAQRLWIQSMHEAIARVREINAVSHGGVHKQDVNRLLEPFMMHTVIATASDWANFFHLRCSEGAHPAIRDAADAMHLALLNSTPVRRTHHLPLIQSDENFEIGNAMRISTGRCARVSYLTHDGKRDPVADLDLAARLRTDNHWSPFEHPATAQKDPDAYFGPFRGWKPFRKEFVGENVL